MDMGWVDVVDLMIAVLGLEILGAIRWGGPALARDLAPTLAAGLGLMLALRVALTGGGPVWLALALLIAVIGHGLDLARRVRGRGRAAPSSDGEAGFA